jgi:molybdenum transport protein
VIHIPDCDIERYIEEDFPYGDLTTHLLGIGDQHGSISFSSREDTVVCCTEEAGRVLEKCGCTVTMLQPSGSFCAPGVTFLCAEGSARSLHAGWKVALNLLEYASGIASRTKRIVDAARAVNPAIAVVTTRKSFPGTKKIAIKAILAGGALPHRLGLSETILVFRQHTAFAGGLDNFLKSVMELKKRSPETKIIVEAETACEAMRIARAGVDVLQTDKIQPDALAPLIGILKSVHKNVKVSAAGGINESNAAEYAATGVDIIVLSSVYFGKPSDIGVTIISANEQTKGTKLCNQS